MSYNLDEQLEGLSEREKEEVFKILGEFSQEGKSKTYEDLIYQDYKEIPVDIITFIKDPLYLGKAWHLDDGTCKLFPYWEKKLKELFPDNINTNYNTFIESGARGLGKSEIAVTCALYLMHRLMCLKNPYTYLNLKPTEQVAFAFMNITEALAIDIGVTKFQNTVQSSPWFMERGTMSGSKNIVWNPPSFINIIIGSQSRHVIGQAIYCSFFDEISFIANQDIEIQKKRALDLIDTAIGGMKTRFTNRGKNPTLLILASSKRSEKSFLEEHIKKKNETDKENTLIVDEPVWNVRPASEYSGKRFYVAQGNRFLVSEVLPLSTTKDEISSWVDRGYRVIDVPIEYHANFLENIDRALCDYAGISSSELTTYISGPRLLACRRDELSNPFVKDVIEVGNAPNDTAQYYHFFDLNKVDPIMKSRPLYIHLDMSMTGDKTGIAGVWIKGKKPPVEGQPQSKELFYQLAFAVSIKAPKGYQVSFEKNRQFIYWLKDQGFNIKGVSSDTFQSADLAQQLIAKNYAYSSISVDRVDKLEGGGYLCKPYHYLKNTIYEERILLFKDDLLTQELVCLERNGNTGKVDHPPNGCFTGDTKVRLTDGRALSFLELVDEFKNGKENYVYSMNLSTHRIEPKKILKAWQTLKNQPLLKVVLDDGSYVKCTLNHKFMLRNGSYIEAEDLMPNDFLMPLHTKYPKVASVERLDECADVYDIEVEDNHNFALDCGVFVHNSKDKADAVCGAVWNASQNAEQFAFDYGETLETIVDVSNTNTYANEKEQIKVAFEEEMQKMFDPMFRKKTEEEQKPIEQKPIENSSDNSKQEKPPFKDFGLGPAEVYKPSYLNQGIIYW